MAAVAVLAMLIPILAGVKDSYSSSTLAAPNCAQIPNPKCTVTLVVVISRSRRDRPLGLSASDRSEDLSLHLPFCHREVSRLYRDDVAILGGHWDCHALLRKDSQ